MLGEGSWEQAHFSPSQPASSGKPHGPDKASSPQEAVGVWYQAVCSGSLGGHSSWMGGMDEVSLGAPETRRDPGQSRAERERVKEKAHTPREGGHPHPHSPC